MSGRVRHGQWSCWGACLRGPGGGVARGRPLFSEEADITLVGKKISIGDQGSAFVGTWWLVAGTTLAINHGIRAIIFTLLLSMETLGQKYESPFFHLFQRTLFEVRENG